MFYSVGIDVSMGKSTIAIISTDGEVISEPFEIEHTKSGFNLVLEKIKDIPKDNVKFVMESTGNYCKSLLKIIIDNGKEIQLMPILISAKVYLGYKSFNGVDSLVFTNDSTVVAIKEFPIDEYTPDYLVTAILDNKKCHAYNILDYCLISGHIDELRKAYGDALSEKFDSPIWEELYKPCLACGTCTFVCPTCQCYDIKDFNTGKGVVRFRCWDSCMYSNFTKMSAGQPRLTQVERFRQRFMHKLVYYPENNDGMFGCVGCGRCLAKCPISMNIVKVMKTIGGKANE